MICHAVVINLADRLERLRAFQHRWLLAGAPVPLHVFPAIPGGDAGCLASHRTVLSTFDGPLLVLEDDACFNEHFTAELHPPRDWDICWLGGQHRLRPVPYNDTWTIPTRLVRTHAYVVRDPAAVAKAMAGIPRMDPHLAALPMQQYVLRTHSVGQAAGRSDIDGRTRDTDEYWQLNRTFSPLPG